MKWQTTAALAAAAVAVGAYIYFVEAKSAPPPADDKTVYMWNLSDSQADPITKLQAKAGTASVSYFKLPPAPTPKPSPGTTPDPLATPPQPAWHQTDKPGQGMTYLWDSTWSDLKRLQASRVIEDHPKDLAMYEFASPSVEVRFGDAKHDDLYVLTVGKKAITGSGYYAKGNHGDAVYLLDSYKVDNFKKLVSEPPVASPTPAPTPAPTPTPKATPSPALPAKTSSASASVGVKAKAPAQLKVPVPNKAGFATSSVKTPAEMMGNKGNK